MNKYINRKKINSSLKSKRYKTYDSTTLKKRVRAKKHFGSINDENQKLKDKIKKLYSINKVLLNTLRGVESKISKFKINFCQFRQIILKFKDENKNINTNYCNKTIKSKSTINFYDKKYETAQIALDDLLKKTVIKFTNIKNNNLITKESVLKMSKFNKFKIEKIKYLNLSHNVIPNEMNICHLFIEEISLNSSLNDWQFLTHLNLRGSKIDSNFISKFSLSIVSSRIKNLDISNSSIDVNGLLNICKHMRSLKHFAINFLEIENINKFYEAIILCKNLESLSMNSISFTNLNSLDVLISLISEMSLIRLGISIPRLFIISLCKIISKKGDMFNKSSLIGNLSLITIDNRLFVKIKNYHEKYSKFRGIVPVENCRLLSVKDLKYQLKNIRGVKNLPSHKIELQKLLDKYLFIEFCLGHLKDIVSYKPFNVMDY